MLNQLSQLNILDTNNWLKNLKRTDLQKLIGIFEAEGHTLDEEIKTSLEDPEWVKRKIPSGSGDTYRITMAKDRQKNYICHAYIVNKRWTLGIIYS